MKKYISLLRVKHYTKNVLIFLPLIFSGHFFDKNLLIVSIFSFLSFSMVASSIYIINDLLDYERDRHHLIKRKRAIASGAVSKRKAIYIIFFLIMGMQILQFLLYYFSFLSLQSYLLSTCCLLFYIGLNIFYSVKGKHMPIVDILILAFGFLLRVIFGGLVTGIAISSWLYLTIISLSLYLVIGKRRGELKKSKDKARPVLKYYTKDFLDKFMYVFLTLTLVFYALWCTIGLTHQSPFFIYSIFFVIFIVMRYCLIVEGDSMGDPVDVFFADKTLLVAAVLYGLYMGGILYG